MGLLGGAKDRFKFTCMFRFNFTSAFLLQLGVVGWCDGVVYLSSPGRPTDIGLQFGKACFSCSR